MVLYTKPPKVRIVEAVSLAGLSDAIAVPVVKDGEEPRLLTSEGIPSQLGNAVKEAAAAEVFKGDAETLYTVAVEGKPYILVGCGDEKDVDAERIRRCFGVLGRSVAAKYRSIGLALTGLSEELAGEAVIATALGAYMLEEFKVTKNRKLEEIVVAGSLEEGYVEAVIEGVYLARDVANAPPHMLSPPKLAEAVRRLFQGLSNVEVEVFSYEMLVREGFGGIVNVGRGSAEKPVLIIIKYRGGEGDPIAFVGKTIVFDSGGINLKPSQGITLMRADKAGGAAVLGAMWAIARMGLKANVYGLLPAAINVPSGESYLPSDVIKMWDGTTVEVGNTDAEGRLVLADAIAYAAKALGAKTIVDLATLTGAIVVALGPLLAGLFTRSDSLASEIEEAARATGERLWRMPLVDDYKALMTKNSPVGEIINVAGRYGGAIYGALFLERFAHEAEWAHLDIAGPGIGMEAGQVAPPYWPSQLAPGYGVRILVELARKRSQG